ncbi:MAG: hypothetical protein QM608_11240 [Caulobacter sp.]
MVYLLGALTCLCLSMVPYGLLLMFSADAGRIEDHVLAFGFSLAAVTVGLVLCWRGWKRSRVAAAQLAISLLGASAPSVVLLWGALT